VPERVQPSEPEPKNKETNPSPTPVARALLRAVSRLFATPPSTLRIPAGMAWNATKVTGLGCSAGLGAAMALNRLPGSILFEVQPGDPAALGIAIAVLGAIAIAACWLAAREATRSDPASALRSE